MPLSDVHIPAPPPRAAGAVALDAVVVEPDPAERRRLGASLGDGARVAEVSGALSARATLSALDPRLVVVGPGVTGPDIAAVLDRADGCAAVVLVRRDPAGPEPTGVAHVVSLQDAPGALAAWFRALQMLGPEAPGRRVDEMVRRSPEAMIAIDAVRNAEGVPVDAVITGANIEGEQLLGLPLEQAHGMRLLEAPGLAGAIRLRDRCVQVLRGDVPREVDLTLGDRWLGCRVVPAAGGATLTLRDVTRRRRTEARRRALAGLADAMAHGAELESLFAQTVDLAARSLDADMAVLCRDGADGASVVAVNRGAPLNLPGTVPEASAMAAALRTHGPARVAIPDTGHGGAWQAAVPVRVDDQVWGSLAVTTGDAGRLPDDAEQVLARFAELLAVALRHDLARAELMARATTDALTGLANRRAFTERLDREIDRARRYGQALSLAIVDLDHFKRVNDAHGHQAGDQVLREAATRLALEARSADLLARIGGEEFAWLMPETDAEAAWQAVDRARGRIGGVPFPHVGTVTASAGVADTALATDADALYARADQALYRAKGAGRDRVVRAGGSRASG